jgi:hypothetical protein
MIEAAGTTLPGRAISRVRAMKDLAKSDHTIDLRGS